MIFLPALTCPLSHQCFARPCCNPVQIMFYHEMLTDPSSWLCLYLLLHSEMLLLLNLQQECIISLQNNPAPGMVLPSWKT